jgi:hypothetical protein
MVSIITNLCDIFVSEMSLPLKEVGYYKSRYYLRKFYISVHISYPRNVSSYKLSSLFCRSTYAQPHV